MKQHHRVVILGAGYAGVRVARDLARWRRKGGEVEIILVNNSAVHLEVPALYEVATAYLDTESTLSSEKVQTGVSVNLTDIFHELPLELKIGTVTDIEPVSRLVKFTDGSSLSYDTLVVAVGAHLATFGIPGVKQFGFSVKTLPEALELRHHIVRHFMMARRLPPEKIGSLLSLVVVGAGAAGVETATELVGQIKKLCGRYGIAPELPHVYLAEAGPDILSMVPPALRDFARQRLQHLGVELMVGNPITAVARDHVVFKNGRTLATHTVIWTGGLTVHPLLVGAQLPLQKWGLSCENTLQVVGHPTIFAVGDCAFLGSYPDKIPATVPVAYTQAATVARNIQRLLTGEAVQPYRYRTLGALITLGGKQAIATLPGGRGLTGFWPWVIKKLVTLRYWRGYLGTWRAIAFWRQGILMQSQND